ncbi:MULTISPECIES: carbohydrate ABC transporter permease [Ensifer]|jgi:ABC-type glycerol-3-phosphate transport system permease component|uniref:ABC transporter permease subunit n=2 Tax=Ensifer TaxID=106591 RepID=A0AAW4FEX2_9HYPH|nr:MULTISPECIES: carbohydrate ABC transporter permease [Ensifer]AHK46709.1 putative sugar ABC transporter, permease protein [Ensifer adhaerens OV14]MDP9629467.1 raffinose/stachyose/melibiose transport system permease protein [Ensifer adhaerens]KQU90787.1 ABC transporter permease [Ensifer sp. Root31]KQW50172.1 ABC transporter permease [Ensifer sp. Root1252]KQW67539.1 ABC transporter permease [Ensifer sp. Root127]
MAAVRRWTVTNTVVLVLLTLHVLLVVFPFIWMIYSTFKTNKEFMRSVWSLPTSFSLDAYVGAWSGGALGGYAVNSLLIMAGATVLTVAVSTLAGYALAVYRPRWMPAVELSLTAAMAIPAYVALVPLVVMLRGAGLLDTHMGVVLPTAAFNVPVTIFIMQAFFNTLPRELFDAARMDGASEWSIFARVALPIARPAMFTAAIVNMIWVWNDFLFPVVFINNPARKTLPVGLTDFVGEHITNYPVMLAAILIAAIAPLVLFIFFERQITAALLGGAVKE